LQFADKALLAAEKAGKNKTPEANSAFEDIRTKLRVFPMPTTESSQKLLKDFMGAESKDEVATNLIEEVGKKSSPTVCIFYTLVLKVCAHGSSLA
jgi:hypothetical protein